MLKGLRRSLFICKLFIAYSVCGLIGFNDLWAASCPELLINTHISHEKESLDPPGISYRDAPEFCWEQRHMAREAIAQYNEYLGRFSDKRVTIERIYKSQFPKEVRALIENLVKQTAKNGIQPPFYLGHEYGQWIAILKNRTIKTSRSHTDNTALSISGATSRRALDELMQSTAAQEIDHIVYIHTHPVDLEGAEILSDRDLKANVNDQNYFKEKYAVEVPFVIIAIPMNPKHEGILTRSKAGV